MERYKYRAINSKGRPTRGVISAANEVDLYAQLQTAGMELLDCSKISTGKTFNLGARLEKVETRDMIEMFIHMEQMQSAGVPMLDALGDIRDASEKQVMRDIMSEITRDVTEGNSLSEAMERHPKVFKPLYISLLKAGEETGDLTQAYIQLVEYLKWVDQLQARIKKATRYPMVVGAVVFLTVVVMMGYVVPQVVGFISGMDQELPFYTKALMGTSEFFQSYWWAVVAFPLVLTIAVKFLKKISWEFAFQWDRLMLQAPIAGPIIRKITIARYAQTFGALYSSGINVISALKSSRETVTNLAMIEAMESVEEYVQAGSPLSDAFNASGEFPSMVIRMLKIGEESGNLKKVLDQISDFYTKDIDDTIDSLIAMIEPGLTAILGILILWIAAAVFGPIYSSFENIDF